MFKSWLVVSLSLKNMKVSWDYYSQHMGEKTFQTPNQNSKLLSYPLVIQQFAMENGHRNIEVSQETNGGN